MMSVERSFEAWEEVQRHGQDLADKLAQGVTGLIQSHITPPSFPWPYSQNSKLFDVELPTQSFIPRDFGIAVDKSAIAGVQAIFDMGNRIGQASKLFDVELPSQSFIPTDFGIPVDSSAIAGFSSIFEIGNKIGQAGAEFGACLNGMVQQFFGKLPVPFRQDENLGLSLMAGTDSPKADLSITLQEDLGLLAERFKGYGYAEKDSAEDKPSEEEFFGVNLKAFKHFGRSQGTINFSSTYESRTRNVESSVAARGDLCRAGMMGWLLINLSVLAKCVIEAKLSQSMILYQLFCGLYILDYFFYEEFMTSTWDIIAERLGFMLVFGDLVFIPFTFSIQGWWLLSNKVELTTAAIIANCLVFLLGYSVFRGANKQKHVFKKDPKAPIWGRPPKVVGGKLLASGYWGIARHCNYLGDLMLALSFSLPCGISSVIPYFYPIYLLILLIWRERRDEARCAEKYKDVWAAYRKLVPYRILPYVY